MISAISVKDRLKKQAMEDGKTMQDKLVTYGLERTIYRLSVSQYAERFTLKGGIFLYALFDGEYARATMDICFWSYKLIGDHMLTVPGSLEHPFYGRWASTYVSDTFRNGNQTMIDIVDRLTEGYTEEQIQNLEHILLNCSKYEYQFWDMAWTKGNIDYRA